MLNVPRLGVSVVVLEGSDDVVLKKGPGHIEDTAYPGEHGNIAIAGHRNTHFKPLQNIRPNDEIVLETKGTTIRYFVDTVQIEGHVLPFYLIFMVIYSNYSVLNGRYWKLLRRI